MACILLASRCVDASAYGVPSATICHAICITSPISPWRTPARMPMAPTGRPLGAGVDDGQQRLAVPDLVHGYIRFIER